MAFRQNERTPLAYRTLYDDSQPGVIVECRLPRFHADCNRDVLSGGGRDCWLSTWFLGAADQFLERYGGGGFHRANQLIRQSGRIRWALHSRLFEQEDGLVFWRHTLFVGVGAGRFIPDPFPARHAETGT